MNNIETYLSLLHRKNEENNTFNVKLREKHRKIVIKLEQNDIK